MNLRDPLKFRHIEGFRAIMFTGTVTGAAAILNVTQPSISQLLKEIEEIVGCRLFHRNAGRLIPSKEAERLYQEIDRCYTGIDHINTFAKGLTTSRSEVLSIATIPSVALAFLPLALSQLHMKLENVQTKVIARHSNDAVKLVSSHKADIGFGTLPLNAPGIVCEKFSTHPLLCVMNVDDPLAKKQSIKISDLNGQNYIRSSPFEGVQDIMDKSFLEENCQPNLVSEITLSSLACGVANAGVGIAVVDHGAVAPYLKMPIAIRPLETEKASDYYAYWRRDNSASNTVSMFFDEMVESAKIFHENLRSVSNKFYGAEIKFMND
ncbi:LysR family transcriptional regulator [Paenochrobactrum glaciei]|uniref:LysR family transcriptional regulator n=1 Tax=Paenochrobactrum glaciei TaxID=486407 RepID=A0ABP3RRM4_9HYPH